MYQHWFCKYMLSVPRERNFVECVVSNKNKTKFIVTVKVVSQNTPLTLSYVPFQFIGRGNFFAIHLLVDQPFLIVWKRGFQNL